MEIEKSNIPHANMEYIYLLDMIWEDDVVGHSNIKYGTIVNNVVAVVINNDINGYKFNIKGDSKLYKCHYNWAFAENTEENIKRLALCKEKEKELNRIKGEYEILKNDVITLHNKKI